MPILPEGRLGSMLGNATEVAGSLGINYKTAQRYLDILTGTFMIRCLAPWTENLGKRARKAPKICAHQAIDDSVGPSNDLANLGIVEFWNGAARFREGRELLCGRNQLADYN